MTAEMTVMITTMVACLSPVAALLRSLFRWVSCSRPADSVKLSSGIPPPAGVYRLTGHQHDKRQIYDQLMNTWGIWSGMILANPTLASVSWVSRVLRSPSNLVTIKHNWWSQKDLRGGRVTKKRDCSTWYSKHNITQKSNVALVECTSALEPSRCFLIASSSFLAVHSSPRSLSMVRSSSSLWMTAVSCAIEELCRSSACSPLSFSLKKDRFYLHEKVLQKIHLLFSLLLFPIRPFHVKQFQIYY